MIGFKKASDYQIAFAISKNVRGCTIVVAKNQKSVIDWVSNCNCYELSIQNNVKGVFGTSDFIVFMEGKKKYEDELEEFDDSKIIVYEDTHAWENGPDGVWRVAKA